MTVGHQPAIRRVKADRHGNDRDPFHGSTVVTSELFAYWEHRRDVVFPAVEARYTRAAEARPYRPAPMSAAKAHIALLRQRESMLTEAGVELESSLSQYNQAHIALRQAKNDCQGIASEAEDRLASLRREKAAAELGDREQVAGFIGNTLSAMSGLPTDPETALPLVPANAQTGQPVAVTGAKK